MIPDRCPWGSAQIQVGVELHCFYPYHTVATVVRNLKCSSAPIIVCGGRSKEVSMGKYGMTLITILVLVVLGLFIFRPI